ncbi:MAG: hypothetical protein ACK56C_15965 [Alphaproteobacteria bacterium]
MLDGLAKVFEALSAIRLWLFAAIFVALTATLLLPNNAGPIAVGEARAKLGGYLPIAWLFSTAVLFFATLHWAIERRAKLRASRLTVTVDRRQSFWAIHPQPDGSLATQISIRCIVHNAGERPLSIAAADLLMPLHWGVDAHPTFMVEGDPAGRGSLRAYSKEQSVHAGYSRKIGVDAIIEGAHGGRGRSTISVARVRAVDGRAFRIVTRLNKPN